MVAKPASIDIEEVGSLRDLVDEMRRDGEPRFLRVDDQNVAVLIPLHAHGRRLRTRTVTAEDMEAFLSSAGGWKDIVDVEQFKRDNAASRRMSTRPPIDV
ncbi:MAG: hypothetical protein DCC58_10835 [Chloroflexi bacterium]|nr:MAG: hypothetical protein DCC58_10835 [Chloroflexota bacterium]